MKRASTRLFIFCTFILFLVFFIIPGKIFAETTPYRSAGWVDTEGNGLFTNLENCQATDNQYCSRSAAPSASALFFGSFPDLENFGIPLNSTLNKLVFE